MIDLNRKVTDKSTLRNSIDMSSQVNRTLIISYLIILTFIMIVVGSTTDKQLFIPDSSYNIPIFSFKLNIKGFYKTIPAIILFLHYVLLFSINLHSEKLIAHRKMSLYQIADDDKDEELIKMHPFIFNHLSRHKYKIQRRINIMAIHAIIFILPLFLLLIILIRFADYQSIKISTFHYVCIVIDVMLIMLYSYNITKLLHVGKLSVKISNLDINYKTKRLRPFLLKISSYWVVIALGSFATIYFVFFILFTETNIIVNTCRVPEHKISSRPKEKNRALSKLISSISPSLDLDNENLIKSMPSKELFEIQYLDERNQDNVNMLTSELLKSHTLSYSLEGRSFKFANFTNCILNKTNFQHCKLQNANFDNSQLKYCNFNNSKLDFSSFNGADLEGASFSKAELNNSSFVEAHCNGVDFIKASIRKVNFKNSVIFGANFSSSDLSGSVFWQSYLIGSIFKIGNCDSVKFYKSDLRGVDFFWGSFRNAYFFNSKIGGLTVYKCNFLESNFGLNCQDSIHLFDPKYYLDDTITENKVFMDFKFPDELYIYTIDSLPPNKNFLKTRRKIAKMNKFIATSMLHSSTPSDRLPEYIYLYKDLFDHINQVKPDYLMGYEFTASGEKIVK